MKKTKEEISGYYRKVYIKSEYDLPKETNGFFAYCKDDKMRFLDYEYINDVTPTEDKNYWLDNVEWYLLPVQQIGQHFKSIPIEEDNRILCTIIVTPEDIKSLIRIRDYFGENDKNQLEHLAFDVLDRAVKPFLEVTQL